MNEVTAIIFATVLRIIDGDTIVVDLPCDIDIVCKAQPLRIAHIDTPEMHGHCAEEKSAARKAKALVEALLPIGSTIVVSNIQKSHEKYDRLLIEIPKVSNALLEKGLARPYEGEKKQSWC